MTWKQTILGNKKINVDINSIAVLSNRYVEEKALRIYTTYNEIYERIKRRQLKGKG